jgi:uncharacterized protein (TIGR02246 family)
MRLSKTAAAAVACLLALGIAAHAADAPSPDEEAIRASAPAWAAAYNAGDAAGIAAMYWEDAVLMPPEVPAVSGRAAIEEFLTTDIAGLKAAGLTMNIPPTSEVGVSGDLAWESGTWSVTDASGTTVMSGKFLGVFERRDGVWHYIRDTWNSDAPAAAE